MPPPPKYPLRFLRWFCREEFLEEIEGNLVEIFDQEVKENPRKAKRAFVWTVLRHFRPAFIKSIQPKPSIIHPAMIRHNLLITYRGFLRNKTSFLINLIGLSTGLASALFIYLWVQDELQVDKFHAKDDQLYQVMHNLVFTQNTSTWAITPLPLGTSLATEFPEVEEAVAVNDFFHWINKEGIASFEEQHIQVSGRHASKNFFSVFSYPLLEGDKKSVFNAKDNVAISQNLAQKLFGPSETAMGKIIEWDNPSFKGSFQVTGVFENPPTHSTEQFDIVFTMDVLQEFSTDRNLNSFRGSYVKTYLTLKKGTDISAFNSKIHDYMEVKEPVNTMSRLFVQLYSDRYLYGVYENGKPIPGKIKYVRLFSAIGIFLLLIACVNFMNLATAKASIKMKEIGVKKTIGATRKALISQFMGESLLLSLMAFGIALILIYSLLPEFNTLTGKELGLPRDLTSWGIISVIVVLTGLIAGSYPALYLSGFDPLSTLKGKLTSANEELFIRKGLVIFQFVLSIIFIVGFLVINRQIRYTQTKNLGYNRNNVICFEWKRELFNPWNGLNEAGNSNQDFYRFMTEMRAIPEVQYVSNMSRDILNLDEMAKQTGVTWKGEEGERDFMFISPVVSYDFIETLGIPLKEGRSFSKERGDDYSKIVLNEAAVAMMEIENPIGKSIGLNSGSEIIGVVKDFHYGSFYNSIEPLIFRCEPHGPNIYVKMRTGGENRALEKIEQIFSEFHPNYAFEYRFLDEDYQALYESETRVAKLSNYFSGLAILISCMGLLGLAAFTAERRKKEIGIRKVLGASVYQLVQLLTLDFTKMVLIAVLIAIPIGYFASSYWLNGFAERINLQGWFFVIAASLTLIIAWLTVASQTILAANVNPVECLKDE